MSGGAVNLQSQVESVLGALVKAASVELTKLFESRYRASLAGHTLEDLCNFSGGSEDSKRSIGVQVNQDINPLLTLSESSFLSDGGCLGDLEEEVLQSCFPPSEILLNPQNDPDDPHWFSLKDEHLGETSEIVEFSILGADYLPDVEDETKVCLHVSTGPPADPPVSASTSLAALMPLVIHPRTSESTDEQKGQFVCPVIVKEESPVQEDVISVSPVLAGPQQAVVGTASGDTYRPFSVKEEVTSTPSKQKEDFNLKEEKSDLMMPISVPIKPASVPATPSASVDPKLQLHCTVKLLDIVSVPDSELNDGNPAKVKAANQKKGSLLSKDLHHHPSSHTGRRLCCFTKRQDNIWLLKKVIVHTRDGYPCSICGKVFKRRKVLRRHERFHTGEKPYPCTICSKAFALRKSLRRHVRFHTGEKPHTCSHCGKKFRLRDNLKVHLRVHSGEKPFSCTTCGKTFRISRNYEKHRLSQCEAFVPSFRTIAGL